MVHSLQDGLALVCLLKGKTPLGMAHGHPPNLPDLYLWSFIELEQFVVVPKAQVRACLVWRPVFGWGRPCMPWMMVQLGHHYPHFRCLYKDISTAQEGKKFSFTLCWERVVCHPTLLLRMEEPGCKCECWGRGHQTTCNHRHTYLCQRHHQHQACQCGWNSRDCKAWGIGAFRQKVRLGVGATQHCNTSWPRPRGCSRHCCCKGAGPCAHLRHCHRRPRLHANTSVPCQCMLNTALRGAVTMGKCKCIFVPQEDTRKGKHGLKALPPRILTEHGSLQALPTAWQKVWASSIGHHERCIWVPAQGCLAAIRATLWVGVPVDLQGEGICKPRKCHPFKVNKGLLSKMDEFERKFPIDEQKFGVWKSHLRKEGQKNASGRHSQSNSTTSKNRPCTFSHLHHLYATQEAEGTFVKAAVGLG